MFARVGIGGEVFFNLEKPMEDFLYLFFTIAIFAIVAWSIVCLDDENAEM
tara:strand:- start:187 stop:336 length:150 start_codon:yes stop_codon:yes gene_type:complete